MGSGDLSSKKQSVNSANYLLKRLINNKNSIFGMKGYFMMTE